MEIISQILFTILGIILGLLFVFWLEVKSFADQAQISDVSELGLDQEGEKR